MKKQTLAKLIILGMVAAMLPISAFAAADDLVSDEIYGGAYDSSSAARPDRPASSAKPTTSTDSETPTEDVTPTTPASGTVSVTAEVSGSTATVSVAADQITAQLESASGAVVIDVQSTGSATEVSAKVPVDALQAIVDNGAVDLSIKSAVGTLTISNADLAAIVEAAGGAEVSISLKVEGGVLEVSVLAGETAITEFAQGVAVSIPAGSYTKATQTDEDGNDVNLTVTVADGVMTLTLFNASPVQLS